MTVEELNLLVTEAILRADTLADLRAPGAAGAYLEVSLIEERIAAALPASDTWGAIARSGAVRAAAVAGEHRRARELAARYLSEEDASPELREQITGLIVDDDNVFAAHHRQAASRFGFADILRVSHALKLQRTPFAVS